MHWKLGIHRVTLWTVFPCSALTLSVAWSPSNAGPMPWVPVPCMLHGSYLLLVDHNLFRLWYHRCWYPNSRVGREESNYLGIVFSVCFNVISPICSVSSECIVQKCINNKNAWYLFRFLKKKKKKSCSFTCNFKHGLEYLASCQFVKSVA